MSEKTEIEQEQQENLERCVNLNNFMKKCFKSSKVSTKTPFSQHVGECVVEVGENKKIELKMALGMVTGVPIISYKDRHFHLSWEDICAIAIAGGLLKPEENEESTQNCDEEYTDDTIIRLVDEENKTQGGEEQ